MSRTWRGDVPPPLLGNSCSPSQILWGASHPSLRMIIFPALLATESHSLLHRSSFSSSASVSSTTDRDGEVYCRMLPCLLFLISCAIKLDVCRTTSSSTITLNVGFWSREEESNAISGVVEDESPQGQHGRFVLILFPWAEVVDCMWWTYCVFQTVHLVDSEQDWEWEIFNSELGGFLFYFRLYFPLGYSWLIGSPRWC